MYTLNEIATFISGQIKGDGHCQISGINTIQEASQGQITFLANPMYSKYLGTTKASAVIISQSDSALCKTNAIVVDDPYVAFARLTHYFAPKRQVIPGVHPSAVIAEGAKVDPSCQIGPNVVIGSGAIIGANCVIGPGCSIGENVQIGAGAIFHPKVVLYPNVVMGNNVTLHSGVVIGSDGFGFAFDKKQMALVKIEHLGIVRMGNHVEIGSNTTIDRAVLGETVIEDFVKIDNLVQIGHNVRIGSFTVIAGCVGIAGSAKIGRFCRIGGAACVSGHIEIADNITIYGMAMVTRSLTSSGSMYASGTGVMEHTEWRKSVARFRHLDEMARRIRKLEKE